MMAAANQETHADCNLPSSLDASLLCGYLDLIGFDLGATPEPSPRSDARELGDRDLVLGPSGANCALASPPRGVAALCDPPTPAPGRTRLVLSEQLVLDSPPPRSCMATSCSQRSARTMTPEANQQTNPVPVFLDGDGLFFSFSIRRADDGGLGLNVEPSSDGRVLLVQSVLPHGAIEAWNRQTRGAAKAPWKAVMPGDKIVCINGATDVAEMLEEIKAKLLLRLLVVRGGLDHEMHVPVERIVDDNISTTSIPPP